MPQGGQHWLQITDGDGLAAATQAPVLARRYLLGPAIDQVLAADDGTDVLWGLADHQGSVRDVCVGGTSIGTLASHRTYDAFGQLVDPSAAVDFIFGYAGRPLDPDTGLYDNRARWYDPATGRFPNEDPLGLAAGDNNLYRYAGNSPVMYVDPSGLCERWAGSIAGAIWSSVSSVASSTASTVWNGIRPIVAQSAVDAIEWGWGTANSVSSFFAAPSQSALSVAPAWTSVDASASRIAALEQEVARLNAQLVTLQSTRAMLNREIAANGRHRGGPGKLDHDISSVVG
jgi:RHS repeat-associated protein